MLSTLSYLTDHLRSDLRQLRAEVGVTNATMVRPTWQAHTHHFPATLWAYVMEMLPSIKRLECVLS
jgi:hypothetical protein